MPTLSPTQPCDNTARITPTCDNEVSWAATSGAPNNPEWYPHFMEFAGKHISLASREDMWTYFICSPYATYNGRCSGSMLPCGRECPSCAGNVMQMGQTCYGIIDWFLRRLLWYGDDFLTYITGQTPDFEYITGQKSWLATF